MKKIIMAVCLTLLPFFTTLSSTDLHNPANNLLILASDDSLESPRLSMWTQKVNEITTQALRARDKKTFTANTEKLFLLFSNICLLDVDQRHTFWDALDKSRSLLIDKFYLLCARGDPAFQDYFTKALYKTLKANHQLFIRSGLYQIYQTQLYEICLITYSLGIIFIQNHEPKKAAECIRTLSISILIISDSKALLSLKEKKGMLEELFSYSFK